MSGSEAIKVSSSVANFREAIEAKYQGDGITTFFGLYHANDYKRFLVTNGKKRVVWCGSDILALRHDPLAWRMIKRKRGVEHICENEVEQQELARYGISARVQPLFFGDADEYPVSFQPSKTPHVFLSAHAQRSIEYGIGSLQKIALLVPEATFHVYGVTEAQASHEMYWDYRTWSMVRDIHYVKPTNIVYHGHVPTATFDAEIRSYQAGLRFNAFDGFSEVTAKSILLGQYPITRIPYPCISQASTILDWVELLQELKHKKEPNPHREYWYKELSKPL